MTIFHVLDAGPLVAADRGDRRIWEDLDEADRAGDIMSVPTVALAQAWRSSRQARLARLLAGCRVVPLTEHAARLAGELCARARSADVVDAAVVVIAAITGGLIWTSDPDDLRVLVDQLPATARPVEIRRVP